MDQNILNEQIRGFISHVSQFSVAIFDISAGVRMQPALGSGTCINVGGKLFILTAAHVVNGVNPKYLNLTSKSAKKDAVEYKILNIVSEGGELHHTTDVAWIEIEKKII